MKDTDTHINTLGVQAPEEAARQVRLRLSTTLGEADLHPPGLAPSQVLLVRALSDPEPGRLGIENPGPTLDRTWERAARDALADCLRRAVRPTNGRVPPDAEAVLFDDAAEAWACWARARVAGLSSAAAPWWTESLETSFDAPASPAGRSPSVAAVWRARPRLVPAVAAHLATWDIAVEAVGQMAEPEAETVLQAVCDAFDVAGPPALEELRGRPGDEPPTSRAKSSLPDGRDHSSHVAPKDGSEEGELKEAPPGVATPERATPREAESKELGPQAGPVRRVVPPWRHFVEEAAGAGPADALAEQPAVYRQLLGVALALHDRPTAVRSSPFQSAWRSWREAVDRSSTRHRGGMQEAQDESRERPRETPDQGSDGPESGAPADREEADRSGRSSAGEAVHPRSDSDRKSGPRPAETAEPGGEHAEEEPSWSDPYAVTNLGGVLYLVNVLNALNLPEAAETPPVGEHVGAWAVLEALARALLGPDDDTLRPSDPLWRVLATLDNRRPEAPAGRGLDEAADASDAYRIPSAWLEAPHVDGPVHGRWAVSDDRLKVWTDLGCVVDLPAADDPAVQAEAEWNQLPNTGRLRRAESADAMPCAPAPDACAPALARWAARAAPYVRHRLAAALGVEAARSDDATAGSEESDWVVDLFTVDARLYTTDLNLDLVCPLAAADLDARVAGLDRSPGWWPPGGRIVRFHFRDSEV